MTLSVAICWQTASAQNDATRIRATRLTVLSIWHISAEIIRLRQVLALRSRKLGPYTIMYVGECQVGFSEDFAGSNRRKAHSVARYLQHLLRSPMACVLWVDSVRGSGFCFQPMSM